MRYGILGALFLLSLQGKLSAQVQASPDTIPLRQLDGTIIHIVGYGNIFESYTETTDGYTIVLSPTGLYVYALQSDTGLLAPSRIIAHDPQLRKRKEKRKLRKIPKHLRNEGAALEKIYQRRKKFNEDINRQ